MLDVAVKDLFFIFFHLPVKLLFHARRSKTEKVLHVCRSSLNTDKERAASFFFFFIRVRTSGVSAVKG